MTPTIHKYPLLFSGRANRPLSRRVAKELGLTLGSLEITTFSDLETHVVVKEEVTGRDVYVLQSTSSPANETLMELLLMVHSLKRLKPKRITAVMPFFGYRRQEKMTIGGESLSFELVAKLLKTAGVNRVLVMDLHKHRSSKYFKMAGLQYKELRAFEVIVNYFKKKKLDNFVVLSPDKGSIPESERYAKALNVPLVIAYKRRSLRKPDEVIFERLEGDVTGKNILIIDDEINTAGTLVGVLEILKRRKARNIYVACTHAVLSGPAIKRLKASSIRQIVVTDTIAIPPAKRLKKMKVLTVTPLFAAAIQQWSRR